MHPIGSIIDGKYEVLKSLGRGGMGEVLLVRHLHLEEMRVIKILRADYAEDEEAQKRFLREARLATQVKHPNVAILYDFSQLPEGSFYTVWEYIEGREVGEWLKERGPFPLLSAIQLGIQTLRGLEAIHTAGVIHRDISPDNLMLTRDRRGKYLVKIIDLGLAKNLVADPTFEVTQVGMFMGKLRYCSPEQAEPDKGLVLDRRSDLYSFALVLYEMICGHSPFEAASPHGAVMKRLLEPPLPLQGRSPGIEVPDDLDRVVARALERDRELRFSDAVEFIEALEQVAFALRQQEPPAPALAPPEASQDLVDRSGAARRSPDDSLTLTKTERLELLAQIERAARRKERGEETARQLEQARELLARRELTAARGVLDALEKGGTQETTLRQLRAQFEALRREEEVSTGGVPAGAVAASAAAAVSAPAVPPRPVVAAAEPAPKPAAAAPAVAARLRELEQMLSGYMKNHQLPLVELTLEALLELSPLHPRRDEYEHWVTLLRQEMEQDRQAEAVLTEAREALGRRDFRLARRKAADLARVDRSGELAPALEEEIAAVEAEERQSADQTQHKTSFEELLSAGDLERAANELERLAASGAPRITVSLCRARLREAREAAQREQRAVEMEERYRERLAAHDWFGARKLVQELEALRPGGDTSALYAEISRREEALQRTTALEQGAAQVEELIRQGRPDQAELALQILLRLDPEYRRRRQLEREIHQLRQRASQG